MQAPAWLANENVPDPLLRLLRDQGLDVQAVSDWMPSASDMAVLRHAHEQGRWLLTFDRDYGELVFARAAPAPPAIVYLRQGPQTMASYAQMIVQLLNDPEPLRGNLVVVDGRRVRRRALPDQA